jgi:hypothetical protein
LGTIFLNSPVQSEDAHLISGVSHHQFQTFNLYRVNPPFVRFVASFPVFLFCTISPCWDNNGSHPFIRNEHSLGVDYVKANSNHAVFQFRIARMTCIIFAFIGGITCTFISFRLYGLWGGIFSLLLWSFSPYILGHAATIMPDAHAASFAIVSVMCFGLWLKKSNNQNALFTGITLGITELCKFTLLIFYPLFIVLWLFYRIPEYQCLEKKEWLQQSKQILLIFSISLLVINMGYLFEETGKPLGSFKFQTTFFTGYNNLKDIPSGGSNRFENSLPGKIPMPLPANFVQGIDTQRLDFERGLPSYLRGEWSDHGWRYYYLYALLLKTPLGTIGLFLLAIFCTFFQKGYNISWRDEMVIILPGIVLLAFVSSQTGFSIHSRYIIPALPFFFIWIAKVGKAFTMQRRIIVILSSILLTWSIFSSLCIYPHSISYFNELAAILPTPEDKNYPKPIETTSKTFWQKTKRLFDCGSRNGARHLLDSNIDWGQDLFYLEKWYQKHPEAQDIKIAYWGSYPLELTTIPSKELPPANKPQPGWYALSVNYIYSREKQYRYFLNFKPITMIGYSIYIYHITQDDIDKLHSEKRLL